MPRRGKAGSASSCRGRARDRSGPMSICAACAWSGCASSGESIWRSRSGGGWGCIPCFTSSSSRAGGGALGVDGLHPNGGPLLRTAERTGSGPALVCGQRAGRSPGRALAQHQRCAALSRTRPCSTRIRNSTLCASVGRYQSWFGVEFEFLLYDVTSTYFEGKALAQREGSAGVFARSAAGLQAGQHRPGGHARGPADGL